MCKVVLKYWYLKIDALLLGVFGANIISKIYVI